MVFVIFAALSVLVYYETMSLANGLTLPELLINPPDQSYFVKYGPCSISVSRLHDAYFVEGKLAASIIKGLNNLGNETSDRDHLEKDDELIKTMYSIIEARDKENATRNFTNNPINALNFMTRIITHFNPALNSIFTSTKLMTRIFYKDLSAVVDRYIREECSCWPTHDDLIIIVRSISRISSTYSLSKKNFIDGYINDERSFKPLSLDQAVAIVHEANRNNYFKDVMDWTNYLLTSTNISSLGDDVNWKTLVRIRAGALFKTNQIKEAISLLESSIKDGGLDTKLLKRDLDYYKSKEEETVSHHDDKKTNYGDRCQYETKLDKDGSLRCYYRQIGAKWDRVQVEMVSTNPPAFKYRRILKEENILHLFDLVKTLKIKTSAYNEKEAIVSDTKFSREMAVVWDDDHHITKYLSRRISYLTGLEVKSYKYSTKLSSSSPFQIINYGIGGYVEPHTDYLALHENEKRKDISAFGGDRMATWMYHLSDKIHGGQLVFMKSNITVTLEKGSGILIFNIFKNGTVNPASEYMECPVALGSKWLATKYIHENGNMFKRKCAAIKRTFF